jgi:hypothetical protein
MFTKEEVAAMAKGLRDVGLDTLGRQYGFLQLACDAEGIAPAKDLKTTDFSRANAFAHRAWRHGSIAAVKRERKLTADEALAGHIKADDGALLPVTEVAFKGE